MKRETWQYPQVPYIALARVGIKPDPAQFTLTTLPQVPEVLERAPGVLGWGWLGRDDDDGN